MIRAYLVDDELHALNILELLLNEIGGVVVVGRSDNPETALRDIVTEKPDVVFLDIEMPGIPGVEMAERLRSELADVEIVFVTAHDEYAIEAFRQDALDYVLKPLEEDRLASTVRRIGRRLAPRDRDGGSRGMRTEEQARPRIRATLLGGFDVCNEHGEALRWHTGKVKELYAFLLLLGETGGHRDVVIDKLWEDEDYAKSKIYLHTCVSYLRKQLQAHGIANGIVYKNEKYYVFPEQVDCDYFAFRRRLQAAGEKEGREAIEEWEQALRLYRGSLLLHCDYKWAVGEIERTNKQWLDACLALAGEYVRYGETRKAIDLTEPLLQTLPYDETVYRLLADCYRAAGKHDEALRMHMLLQETLQEYRSSWAKEQRRRTGSGT
ncbi:MAG: histidine kinase [Paenibacillus sp.]|jgi:two-component SAPR family response regulator|nr:histidine kinase [Paenibacillus sp.]